MKKPPLLDLHGYRLADVPDAVDRFLVQCTTKGVSRGRIMTGKGTGQVKAAVISYLRQGGYPFELEKLPNGAKNEGVLVVIFD
jgi:DNA-nicking Smr family endonuclease